MEGEKCETEINYLFVQFFINNTINEIIKKTSHEIWAFHGLQSWARMYWLEYGLGVWVDYTLIN
jgi:hypothetical protein